MTINAAGLENSVVNPERARAVTHLERTGPEAVDGDQKWQVEIRRFIEEDAGISDPNLAEKTFDAYRRQRDMFIGQLANTYDAALLRGVSAAGESDT